MSTFLSYSQKNMAEKSMWHFIVSDVSFAINDMLCNHSMIGYYAVLYIAML